MKRIGVKNMNNVNNWHEGCKECKKVTFLKSCYDFKIKIITLIQLYINSSGRKNSRNIIMVVCRYNMLLLFVFFKAKS